MAPASDVEHISWIPLPGIGIMTAKGVAVSTHPPLIDPDQADGWRDEQIRTWAVAVGAAGCGRCATAA